MKKQIKKALLFSGLVSVFIVGFLVIFYFWSPLNQFNSQFFRIIPYPVAYVEGKIITTKNLLEDLDSLKKFYDSQDFSEVGLRIDFKTEEGKHRLKIKEKEVLNKLIENQIIRKLANSKNIFISSKEAEQEIIKKAQATGSVEDLALNLKKLYGWSLGNFRDKVVLPRLYLQKLISYYNQEIFSKKNSQGKIKKAHQELNKKTSFEEVAKKYSEGETADNGGALGWFKKEYLSEAIAEKAFSMNSGEFSEIINTSLGSHIIYLEEIRGEKENKEVKIKQIFTKEGSFLDWLNKNKKEAKIKIFIQDYNWNNSEGKVEFSDQSLQKKERVLKEKSEGDPVFY